MYLYDQKNTFSSILVCLIFYSSNNFRSFHKFLFCNCSTSLSTFEYLEKKEIDELIAEITQTEYFEAENQKINYDNEIIEFETSINNFINSTIENRRSADQKLEKINEDEVKQVLSTSLLKKKTSSEFDCSNKTVKKFKIDMNQYEEEEFYHNASDGKFADYCINFYIENNNETFCLEKNILFYFDKAKLESTPIYDSKITKKSMQNYLKKRLIKCEICCKLSLYIEFKDFFNDNFFDQDYISNAKIVHMKLHQDYFHNTIVNFNNFIINMKNILIKKGYNHFRLEDNKNRTKSEFQINEHEINMPQMLHIINGIMWFKKCFYRCKSPNELQKIKTCFVDPIKYIYKQDSIDPFIVNYQEKILFFSDSLVFNKANVFFELQNSITIHEIINKNISNFFKKIDDMEKQKIKNLFVAVFNNDKDQFCSKLEDFIAYQNNLFDNVFSDYSRKYKSYLQKKKHISFCNIELCFYTILIYYINRFKHNEIKDTDLLMSYLNDNLVLLLKQKVAAFVNDYFFKSLPFNYLNFKVKYSEYIFDEIFTLNSDLSEIEKIDKISIEIDHMKKTLCCYIYCIEKMIKWLF